jgi:predicted RNA binding protein YcfA (HicA-like mRNA interferase family)
MRKFPIDTPKTKVVSTFERFGFRLVREGNHISMARENADGTRTLLTIPNHRSIKGSTLRTILTQAGIGREEFLEAMEQ